MPNLVRQATHMKRARDAGVRIIIDSGAFTMMQEARKVGGKANVTRAIEAYTDRYIAWASQMRSMFHYCVEMDLQHVVGLPRVQAWRRAFEAEGLRRQLWLAYHSCDDWPALDEVVQRSRWDQGGSGYMGIEGKNHPMSYRIDYRKAAMLAYRDRVCVHAFASTNQAFLQAAPLASSDSTSWKASERYGTTAVYSPLKVGTVTVQPDSPDPKARVASAARAWRRGGFAGSVDISTVRRQADEVRKYLQMERAVTGLWRARGIDWEAVEADHAAQRSAIA
jgi:hypothetical protein